MTRQVGGAGRCTTEHSGVARLRPGGDTLQRSPQLAGTLAVLHRHDRETGRGIPVLWDVNEHLDAILEGPLTSDEQPRALLNAERVVNGLFAHLNSLHGWLASLTIHLDRWTPVGAALHSSS